jgi:ubiquinone/menaquinone biosynthesis C-methylase UbiE
MKVLGPVLSSLLLISSYTTAFNVHFANVDQTSRHVAFTSSSLHSSSAADVSIEPSDAGNLLKLEENIQKRSERKNLLLGLLGSKAEVYVDPVLACPFSKTPLEIVTAGPVLGYSSNMGVRCTLRSQSGCHTFTGRTDTYFNLLEPVDDDDTPTLNVTNSNALISNQTLNALKPLIPPFLRSILSTTGLLSGDDEYIPMRDLFTSPSVSFAYERGWRQGFAAAGFPGVEKEYEMVRDYFHPIQPQVVVDMSCATGLFTRRFAKSNEYPRVIGCDYSDAMLLEARSRINSDFQRDNVDLKTRLDLVRCDVAKIPMQTMSVDALHAGAAMHCWPDLDAGLSEIHRVLKNGGRFFATTFLSRYMRFNSLGGGEKVFQYFDSADQIEQLLIKAGFDRDHIQVSVIGQACIVVKAEKS